MNGKVVYFPDVKPENVNGRVLVPIRTISEEMGAEVTYNDATKQFLLPRMIRKFFLQLVPRKLTLTARR